MENSDDFIYEDCIENFRRDIKAIQEFKEYLKREDFENMVEYLNDFIKDNLKDRKIKLNKVIEMYKKNNQGFVFTIGNTYKVKRSFDTVWNIHVLDIIDGKVVYKYFYEGKWNYDIKESYILRMKLI